MYNSVYNLISTQTGRVDKIICTAHPEFSRSQIQNYANDGLIFINGKIATKNSKVKEGDKIDFEVPSLVEPEITAENIPLDIVYEDEYLLVVNKAKGMVVHPAPGNYEHTLVNALMYHCKDSLSGINGVLRPGIVHRIDKDTSGLLIVAKNDFAHKNLAEQIKEHSFKREYLAVVYGRVKTDSGTIDAPIGRNPKDRKKMAVIASGTARNAITHYEVLEELKDFTYAKLKLETGRTHQIRVHMAYLGHPVAGDPVYGPKKVINSLNGQCLHAYLIGFIHPKTGEYLEFTSSPPKIFEDFIKKRKTVGESYER